MDRRAFLTRLGLLTAAAAVIDPMELIERLAPRRLYVAGADLIAPPTIMTVGSLTTLADLYRKTNSHVIQALKMSTPELQWFRSIEGYVVDRKCPPRMAYFT